MGAETTAKLIKMRILLVGLRGVGIETAKNLALQGAGAITILDPTPTDIKDVGSNFFLHEEDAAARTPRAVAIAPRLQELNPLCTIGVADALTDEVMAAHSALIITQFMPLAELTRLNDFCRARNIAFFYAFIGGVSSTIFTDLGAAHVVNDFDGERPQQKLIVSVSPFGPEGKESLIRYEHVEGQQPNIISSGHFEVTEVEGVDGINGVLYPVSHNHKDPAKTIRIPLDISALPAYVKGGLLTEKKLPTASPMESFAAKLKNPGELVMTDLIKFGAELQQHIALVAVSTFAVQKGHLPRPNNVEDAAAVLEIAKTVAPSKVVDVGYEPELDESFITR
jgi:ubiquitin-activating enzyme E1